jgi:hypothetical protein
MTSWSTKKKISTNGHLCVLLLETALATLVITWFILADRRFREQLGQRFTFLNFFPMMTDNA